VAEQLALDEGLGHGGQVDGDERPARPRRIVVDGAGDQLLAGAALAGDEHRRRRAGDAADQREDLAHRLAAGDDVGEAVGLLDLALEAGDLAAQAALAQRLAGDQQELLDLEGLGDVVVGAQLDGADRGLDGAERRDHHHVRRLGERHDVADEVEAVEVGHPQVGDDQVDRLGAHHLEADLAARRRPDHVAGVGELLGEEVAHRVVVLDHQDGRARPVGRGHHPRVLARSVAHQQGARHLRSRMSARV
jgi:hypothetical protein